MTHGFLQATSGWDEDLSDSLHEPMHKILLATHFILCYSHAKELQKMKASFHVRWAHKAQAKDTLPVLLQHLVTLPLLLKNLVAATVKIRK
jgi:hypothetical protein